MEPDDFVLSDVHVGTDLNKQHSQSQQYQYAVTRFEVKFPLDGGECSSCHGNPSTDEDGDFVIRRQYAGETIHIKHAMSTRLEDVGLQVWSGALLMCDFLIHQRHLLMEAGTVVELGSGTGLVSLVAAKYAHRIYCTDIGSDVLHLCQENMEKNAHLAKDDTNVMVKALDWMQEEVSESDEEFGWGSDDVKHLQEAELLLAAEVVYDEDLTEGFFRTIHRLMTHGRGSTLYVTLEKRLNFTLSDLDVAASAYDHFRQCVDQLCSLQTDGAPTFSAQQLSCDFPQYLQYDRHKNLELWKIEAKRNTKD